MSFDSYSSSSGEDSGEDLSGSDYESQFGGDQHKLFDIGVDEEIKKSTTSKAGSKSTESGGDGVETHRTDYTEISSDDEDYENGEDDEESSADDESSESPYSRDRSIKKSVTKESVPQRRKSQKLKKPLTAASSQKPSPASSAASKSSRKSKKKKPSPASSKKSSEKGSDSVQRPRRSRHISQAELKMLLLEQQHGTPTTLSTLRGSASSEDIQDLQEIMDAPSVTSMAAAAAVNFSKKPAAAVATTRRRKSTTTVKVGKLKKSKSGVIPGGVAATGLTAGILKKRLAKDPDNPELKAQLRLARLNEVSADALNSLLSKRAMLESRVARLSKELKAAKRELKQVSKNINAQIEAVNSI